MPVGTSFGDASRVYGLRDLARAAKQMKADLPTGLRPAAEAAAQVVIRGAQENATHVGVLNHAGHPIGRGLARAMGSLRAFSTQKGAGVRGGSASVPDFAGWEYGSGYTPRSTVRGVRMGYGQFAAQNNGEGYALNPAVNSTRAQQLAVWLDAVDNLLHESGVV